MVAVSDERPQLSDSIPIVIDAAREMLGHLLRLIRPTKADLIDRLVGALARYVGRVAELIIAQSEHRAAAAVEPMIDLARDLERRVAALERPEQAREVGGDARR